MDEQNVSTPAVETPSQEHAVDSIENLENSEGQDGNESAPAAEGEAGGTKAEKEMKKAIKKLKLKVDKGEVEEELPFELPDDPKAVDYMTRQLQMAKMGQKRAQEYSELNKKVTEFFEKLQKNPRQVLSDPTIGIDLKKIAAEMIEEEIENAKLSPEQKRQSELEKELKAIKDEREKEKKEYERKEFERLQEQELIKYDKMINDSLANSKLPQSPYVIKKIADYMLMGLQEGLDVKPEDVISIVEEEIQSDIKSMFAVMPEEAIESIIGKEYINKVRAKNVKKAKETKIAQKPVVTSNTSEKPTNKQTMRQVFGF